ncbi:aminotransferase class IV [Candidatus Nomurabacteria bacterium]|nr:aminotransferase class IV [Candidatus Nomurabacteria bacterium]
MMTTSERPFMLQRHIDRLFQSCRSIDLKLPWSKEQVAQWVLQTFEANTEIEGEKVMRLIVSGGPTWTLKPADIPTIVIMVESRIKCSPQNYKNGVHVLLSEFQRYEPEAKTTNYIQAIRELGAISNDIDEVIYHSQGLVREGTRSNIFAVINGSLITPRTKVLEGITRGIILNDLPLSFHVKAKDFSVTEFQTASEVFITATSKNIMPVTKISGKPVGDGVVGPMTNEIMKEFDIFFSSKRW